MRRKKQDSFAYSPEIEDMVIAYNPSATWLAFFETSLCEDNIASSNDVKVMSEAFGTPVIAFSLLDSDVLFASYCDSQNKVFCNHAKLNDDITEHEYMKEIYENHGVSDMYGMHGIDTEIYSTDSPTFILGHCNQQQQDDIKGIWETIEVFAEDKMEKIREFMQVKLLYNGNNIPDGYEAIRVP